MPYVLRENGGDRVPAVKRTILIARDDSTALWYVEYRYNLKKDSEWWLTEADAYFTALELGPGTPTQSEVDEIDTTAIEQYGRSLKEYEMSSGKSLYDYLVNDIVSLEPDHEYYQKPRCKSLV